MPPPTRFDFGCKDKQIFQNNKITIKKITIMTTKFNAKKEVWTLNLNQSEFDVILTIVNQMRMTANVDGNGVVMDAKLSQADYNLFDGMAF